MPETPVSPAPLSLEPRLSEILDLAREWARPYATGCVHGNGLYHPLDCPRGGGEMCFECANEALALGVLALIGEEPSSADA